jgi:hypothetical protein
VTGEKMDILFEPERKTSLGNYDVAVEEDKKHSNQNSQDEINYEGSYMWCFVDMSRHMGM